MYVQTLYDSLICYQADISICELFKNENEQIDKEKYLLDKDEIIAAILSKRYRQNNSGPWCKLFVKDLIERLCFDENIYLGEDTLFCVEYAKKCKRGVYVHKGLYHYDMPTTSLAYRSDSKLLTKYLTYIESRQEMLKDTTMLNRNSFLLIVNSLFESIQQSYFVAKKRNRRDVQEELCRLMNEMQNRYCLGIKEQDKPVSWLVMSKWPHYFDTWMYIYGKYHGLLFRLGI